MLGGIVELLPLMVIKCRLEKSLQNCYIMFNMYYYYYSGEFFQYVRVDSNVTSCFVPLAMFVVIVDQNHDGGRNNHHVTADSKQASGPGAIEDLLFFIVP